MEEEELNLRAKNEMVKKLEKAVRSLAGGVWEVEKAGEVEEVERAGGE